MERSTCVRLLLGLVVAGSLATLGCKKSEDPATVPVPSASSAATVAPAPSATDAPSASATASSTAATTAAPQPVAVNTATNKPGESIDACCNALNAAQKSGKSAVAKSKAASAAAVCPGIAKLVKAGTTSRAAGLSQIRSALTGFDVPAECH